MVLKRATDVGGKCFWKCHRKLESSLVEEIYKTISHEDAGFCKIDI